MFHPISLKPDEIQPPEILPIEPFQPTAEEIAAAEKAAADQAAIAAAEKKAYDEAIAKGIEAEKAEELARLATEDELIRIANEQAAADKDAAEKAAADKAAADAVAAAAQAEYERALALKIEEEKAAEMAQKAAADERERQAILTATYSGAITNVSAPYEAYPGASVTVRVNNAWIKSDPLGVGIKAFLVLKNNETGEQLSFKRFDISASGQNLDATLTGIKMPTSGEPFKYRVELNVLDAPGQPGWKFLHIYRRIIYKREKD